MPRAEHSRRDGSGRLEAVLARSPRALGAYFPDLNGIPRGKEVAAAAIEDALAHGVPMTASIFALDYGGDAVEGTGLAPEILFRDLVVRPDTGSVRRCPWTGGAIAAASASVPSLIPSH